MARGELPKSVALTVHDVETLERDGRSVRTGCVFCPLRHESTDVKACATCPFASAVSDAEVHCGPPVALEPRELDRDASLFLGPDARATRMHLGAVCAPRAVAVRDDVPLAQAAALLKRERYVLVLTGDDEVCGVLSAAEPPADPVVDGVGPPPVAAQSKHLELGGRFRVLPESTPLSEAIGLMVHGHVRLVAVTTDRRRFVGLVTDLDVLRWAADTRGLAPR